MISKSILTTEQKESVFSFIAPFVDYAANVIVDKLKEWENEKEPKYYNRQELAHILHVSLPTIHNLMNKGIIIPKRVGKRVLFSQDEIREQMENGALRKYGRKF